MIAVARRPLALAQSNYETKKLDLFLFQKFKAEITVIIGAKLAPLPSTRQITSPQRPRARLSPASEHSRPYAHDPPRQRHSHKELPPSLANHQDSRIPVVYEKLRQTRRSGEAVIACQTALYHELSIKSWCIVISTEKNGHLQPLITDSQLCLARARSADSANPLLRSR